VTDAQPIARPFADWLREQSAGRTHDELSQALHDLVSAVQLTGKKGTLTLTVELKPIAPGDVGTLVATDRVVLKAPANERARSVFFVDRHGRLTRNDPNQLEFEPLREVPAPEQPTTPTKAKEA
jgi:hypothetical protein